MSFPDLATLANQTPMARQGNLLDAPPSAAEQPTPPPEPVKTAQPEPLPPPDQPPDVPPGLYDQAEPGDDWQQDTPEQYRERYRRAGAGGQPILMLHPREFERMYRGGEFNPWRREQEPRSEYIPASANRGFSGWGRPWWPIEAGMSLPQMIGSPYMPSPTEAYRVLRGAGGQLAMYGSAGVAGPMARGTMFAMQFGPILDMLTGGRFTQGFNAARLGTMKIQQQQMMMDFQIGQQRHAEELLEFGRVFELAKIGAISDDEARHRVRDLAIQFHHPYLETVLNNKDLGGVEEYLNWEDAKMRDVWAAHTSIAKATGGESDADIARSLGREPSEAAGGRPGTGVGGVATHALPTKQGYSPEAPQPSAAGQVAGPGVPASDFNVDLQKRRGLTQEELDIARSIAGGEDSNVYNDLKKSKSPFAGAARGRIDAAADEIRNRVNAIANNRDPNVSTDDKLNELEQIQPNLASKVRGLLELGLDPEKDIPAAGHARERITALARAINPHWKTNSFKLAQQYEELNKPAVRTVQRVSSLLPAVNGLNTSLLAIPEDQKIPVNWLKKIYANNWTGDPAYTQLYTSIVNVLKETSAITNGGVPRIGDYTQRAKEMLNTMSPAQIRTQLLRDVQSSYGFVRTIEGQFKTTVGDPNAQLPFFPKAVRDDFRAIMRMNPYTGEMPSDASGAVLATTKKGGHRPSWLNTDQNSAGYQAWTPLTEKQVVEGRRQIRANQNSPDPRVQAAIQAIRRRLGEFATAEPGDPDYAEEQRNR